MTTTKIENKLAALKKEYEEKYSAELDNAKKDIEAILENLNGILDSVEEKDRAKILKGAKIGKLIAALGVEPSSKPTKTSKRKTKTSRAELTQEGVISFIGKGSKTKSELSAHFKGGNIKVIKFLDGLVKAKILDSFGSKSKKNKDVTNYKVK